MYTKHHVFLGVIFSFILFLIFPKIGLIGFSLIILSTIFIDVDHYVYYIYKKKDWSLRNAYNWFIKAEKIFFSLPRSKRNKTYIAF